MSSSQEQETWDRDTDDVQSEDSEDLYESRPNRWRGKRSTWRDITEQDRLQHNALIRVQNHDLSIQLYNAFALKHVRSAAQNSNGSPSKQDRNSATGEVVGEQAEWAPPKSWTAWPDFISGKDPGKGLMDDYDVGTMHKDTPPTVSGLLEEIVSATILGLAKERFTQRQLATRSGDTALSQPDTDTEMPSGASSRPLSRDESAVDLKVEHIQDSDRDTVLKPRLHQLMFEPVVSADDEASYALLRPVTRQILGRLDQTLTVLHNARVAGIVYQTDSSATETEAESQGSADGSRKRSTSRDPKRRVGRPRSQAPMPSETRSTSKRGRPRRLDVPREGESEREMLIRVARERHRRMPVFSDEENDEVSGSTAEEAKQKAATKRGRKRRTKRFPKPGETKQELQARIARQYHRRIPQVTDDDGDSDGPCLLEEESFLMNKKDYVSKMGLRDWSNVVGAAALAGFSPEVIARTKERCSKLFGQDMRILNLEEGPANPLATARTTSPPASHPIHLSADESEDTRRIAQLRVTSRQSSLAILSSDSDEETGASSKKRRRRSSVCGQFYCTFETCARAGTGFTRLDNLRRHLKLVHGQTKAEPSQEAEEDVKMVHAGGEEEANLMAGAVHIDGFLRPIKLHKGWRGKDKTRRDLSRSRPQLSSPDPDPAPEDVAAAISEDEADDED